MTCKKVSPFNLLVTGHTRAGKTDFLHTLVETLKNVLNSPNSLKNSRNNRSSSSVIAPSELNHKLFSENITAPTPLFCPIECYPDPESNRKISVDLIDSPGLSIPAGVNRAPQESIEKLER